MTSIVLAEGKPWDVSHLRSIGSLTCLNAIYEALYQAVNLTYSDDYISLSASDNQMLS